MLDCIDLFLKRSAVSSPLSNVLLFCTLRAPPPKIIDVDYPSSSLARAGLHRNMAECDFQTPQYMRAAPRIISVKTSVSSHCNFMSSRRRGPRVLFDSGDIKYRQKACLHKEMIKSSRYGMAWV